VGGQTAQYKAAEISGMKTYYLTLDLKDDPALIEEYKRYHQSARIWPEVMEQIRSNGVLSEEIYLAGVKMVMILRTTDDFSFEAKLAADLANPKMQEWERLMLKYQQPASGVQPGKQWVLMQKIFEA
jgi:L-rhamnose mutarotase